MKRKGANSVAKCHGYDRYIRVKYWQVEVKIWENMQFSKIKPFLGIFMGIN